MLIKAKFVKKRLLIVFLIRLPNLKGEFGNLKNYK